MRYKLRDSEDNIYDIDTDFEEDEDIELEKISDSEEEDFDETDFDESEDLTFSDGLDEIDDADKNNFAKKEDDDEEELKVEEEIVEKGKEEKPAKKPNGLESDEIDALKQLAKIAPELLALVQTKKTDKKKVVEKDEIEVKKAEEEAPVEDSNDKVICDDSRKAFGSIELHKKQSSFEDEQARLDDEIAKAWDNRKASHKK